MKINITILEDSISEFNRLQKGILKYSKLNNLDINIDAYNQVKNFFYTIPTVNQSTLLPFFLTSKWAA